jgi:hypothetical protein
MALAAAFVIAVIIAAGFLVGRALDYENALCYNNPAYDNTAQMQQQCKDDLNGR